ncbi:YaaA family protein [bacterium]|nr:YaaA family protein [bacterium]
MKILLNSTKTMDPTAAASVRFTPTSPACADRAAVLATALKALGPARLKKDLALSDNLLPAARTDIAMWGEKGRPAAASLFAFTGLVYKHLDAPSLTSAQLRDAQKHLRILSGLYGYLRPFDLIEAYRLEMGARWSPPGAKNLVAYWRDVLTSALDADLKRGEPVIDLCAQEYMKAVDTGALRGPVISPVFKETRPDGSFKTAPVHAKMARGAMARFIVTEGAKAPSDLLGFHAYGWEAASEPPAAGPWLFTRPATG